MSPNNFEEIISRSVELRKKYHELEMQHYGSKWSVEEDALAFLTDAGLVGRNVMSQQQRWPKSDTQEELEHKLGESIWWLTILADRMGMNIQQVTENFLSKTEQLFQK